LQEILKARGAVPLILANLSINDRRLLGPNCQHRRLCSESCKTPYQEDQ
jgi:hypothetical protein